MLDTFIDDIERRRKRLTVYAPDDETGVDAQFATRNADVEHQRLGSSAEPFVVVHEGGEFAGAIALSELRELLAPPVGWLGRNDDRPAVYSALFELLEDTVFTALDRRQLLAASREIEDRVRRVGTGTFHAGFQSLSRFRPQADAYRHLAASSDLDIHVYGAADWSPPEIAGVTYHLSEGDPVERFWFLAFDGGGDDSQACALLARERDGGYVGFWTYDPDLVSRITASLAVLAE